MHLARPWFDLARHEDPPAPPAPAPVTAPVFAAPPAPLASPTPPVSAPPATGTAGESAPQLADTADDAAKWKELAQKHEKRAKENAEAAKELAAIKAAEQTEHEKTAARAEAAEKAADTLRKRVLAAEIKAAAGEFADPADAALYLDLATYGEDPDPDAIKADLAALLKAKPHLAKATAPPLPPDLLQGARGGDPTPVDFRSAPKEDFAKEAAKYGIKVR